MTPPQIAARVMLELLRLAFDQPVVSRGPELVSSTRVAGQQDPVKVYQSSSVLLLAARLSEH